MGARASISGFVVFTLFVTPAVAEELPVSEMAEAPPVEEAVRELLQTATSRLAQGDADAALESLTEAEAKLPEGSWLRAIVGDLRAVAERVREKRKGRGGPRREGQVDDATLEDIAVMYTDLTLYGFWTGIWALGILAEQDEDVFLPLSVVTGAAGVGIAYLLDHRDTPLTGGTAAAINFGLQYGTIQALLTMLSFDLWDDLDGKEAASVMWAGGVAGGAAGGALAEWTGATRGQLALIYSGALWGAVFGLTTALTADVDSGRSVAQLAQAGSLAGVGATMIIGTQVPVSRSRALFIDLGGLSGGLVGAAIMAVIKPDSPTPAGIGMTLAIGSGLGLATYLTRDLDEPADDELDESLSVHLSPTWLVPPGGPQPGRALVPGLALGGAF